MIHLHCNETTYVENHLIVFPGTDHMGKYWISTDTFSAVTALVLGMSATLHQRGTNSLLSEEMNTVYFKGGTTTSSLLHKILLQVVTVDLGSTENNCLIHLVFLDGSDSILPLQDFNSFRPHLLNNTTTITKKNTEFQSEIVRNTHNHTDLQLNSPKNLYFNATIIAKSKQ